jgi:hypothetical protein
MNFLQYMVDRKGSDNRIIGLFIPVLIEKVMS